MPVVAFVFRLMARFVARCAGLLGVVVLPLLALLLVLPIVAIALSWASWGQGSAQVLGQMAATVLPDYALTSLALCAMVAVGVALLGVGAAVLVSVFDFAGRALWQWLLLLPMAMPAYVVAYAYTDGLQYSGPVQTALRHVTGWQGPLWPDVRHLFGAAAVFSLALYPYVYLLVRSALLERASGLLEAARLLGASMPRRLWQVALPMARPAVAAGVALALMETLADYGVSSYFGIQTFTAGVYKAWLVLDDRMAAAQLATVLLVVVLALRQWEQHAQSRARFAAAPNARMGTPEAQPLRLRGAALALAWAACAVPVVLGFVAPVAMLLWAAATSQSAVPWARFAGWAAHSVALAGAAALLAVALALALAFSARVVRTAWALWAVRLVGMGYAIPGAVVVVGLLLPLGWVQQQWPQSSVGAWLTATSLGLMWAYLVRFCAVALESVQSGYARVGTHLDESARTLGVTGWRLWQRVHLPLLGRTTGVALLLVFVDVMKELPATMVLRPFDSDTLAVVAYQLARDERLGDAAWPSLALVLVGLLPVLLLGRSLRSAAPAH